jgi:anti-sigma B factor antagonist
MSEERLSVGIRRASTFVIVLDIHGSLTSFTEKALQDAFNEAVHENIQTLIFNFTDMSYLNSLGIGMLVTLLVRARKEGRSLAGYGLSDHYKNIFELTRLDQMMPIYATEEIAIASTEPYDLTEREY